MQDDNFEQYYRFLLSPAESSSAQEVQMNVFHSGPDLLICVWGSESLETVHVSPEFVPEPEFPVCALKVGSMESNPGTGALESSSDPGTPVFLQVHALECQLSSVTASSMSPQLESLMMMSKRTNLRFLRPLKGMFKRIRP